MPNVLCLACTTPEEEISFPSLKDLKVHEMTGHPKPEKKLPVDPRGNHPSATELKVPIRVDPVMPIEVNEWAEPVLEYRWIGKHRKCNTDLRTITVIVGEEGVAVQFCPNCNIQLEQRKVIPIEKQFSEKTVKRK